MHNSSYPLPFYLMGTDIFPINLNIYLLTPLPIICNTNTFPILLFTIIIFTDGQRNDVLTFHMYESDYILLL